MFQKRDMGHPGKGYSYSDFGGPTLRYVPSKVTFNPPHFRLSSVTSRESTPSVIVNRQSSFPSGPLKNTVLPCISKIPSSSPTLTFPDSSSPTQVELPTTFTSPSLNNQRSSTAVSRSILP